MAAADRKRGRRRVAAAAAGHVPDTGHFLCRRCRHRSGQGFGCLPQFWLRYRCSPAAMLGGCAGGDFGRTRENARNDDMHRWIGIEATASVGLRASQFQLTDKRTPAARSRLSADRAAAFAPRLEDRVRRLPADAGAVAAGAIVRSHRLWPAADRRAASLAHLALQPVDRGRPQRPHAVRSVLRQRGPGPRSRQASATPAWRSFRICRRASAPTRSRA